MRGVIVASCLLAALAAAATRPCDVEPGKSLPFCDTKLTFEERVKDLVGRLTVQEKAKLSVNGASAVSRLNIPAYQWWSEALHGVGYSPGVSFGGQVPHATAFPQVITTGSSWNRTLFHAIGSVISTEARAFNNQNRAGLTFWAPNINVYRDPRWGRGQETPGEDPYLTSEYAKGFVTGMQDGEDSRYLKVSSCCKHYSAYDFEDDYAGTNRHNFNAIVDDRDMAETYMPPFEACVRGAHASSLMCSYNAINGVPACADGAIMNDLAKKQWGFKGYITSDCAAVDDVQYNHHYTSTTDDTCRVVLEAGMDIECGSYFTSSNRLVNAVNDGKVKQATLDEAVTNQFLTQFRLGMFDPAADQPYTKISPQQVDTSASKALALEAAQEGLVLLKNNAKALPFASSIKTVTVVGPNAAATSTLLGNYNGNPSSITSVVDGIRKFATVKYYQGCDVNCANPNIGEAKTAASSSDATVVVIGIDGNVEGESRDRRNIALPGKQAQVVADMAAASKGPVIVVIIAGGQVDVSGAKADNNVDGILWAGYPGQSGGDAVANVLFGKFNPSGRLTYTIYPSSYTSLLKPTDMTMRPEGTKPGRTYKFYTGTPVYAFGDGLSYTTFNETITQDSIELSSSIVSKSLRAVQSTFTRDSFNKLLDVSVVVKNTGSVAGGHVALFFVVPPHPGVDGAPLKTLAGFERVFLAPGESQTVVFPVTAADLSLFNAQGQRETVNGRWTLSVGSSSVPVYLN